MLGLRQKLSLGFGGLPAHHFVDRYPKHSPSYAVGASHRRDPPRKLPKCYCLPGHERGPRADGQRGALYLSWREAEGTELIQKNEALFEKALQAELSNITLPGEGEKAARLQELFKKYKASLHEVQGLKGSIDQQREVYFSKQLPCSCK